jgi:hypothetical protein
MPLMPLSAARGVGEASDGEKLGERALLAMASSPPPPAATRPVRQKLLPGPGPQARSSFLQQASGGFQGGRPSRAHLSD